MADKLTIRIDEIVEANKKDLDRANAEGLSLSLMARLKLDKPKLIGEIQALRKLAELKDPLGTRQLHRELDSDLILERITVPLGVIGVIFEARPDALIQIASLAIRSGNGAILKGGSEASLSNEAIIRALKDGLKDSVIHPQALELLTTRQESLALLRLEKIVDLIIPRGSNELVRFIQENTQIPVLGHADGICHLYVDVAADIDKAIRITTDSKTQYPAACNAIETLLVHQDIAEKFLLKAIPTLQDLGVILVGDKASQDLGIETLACEDDWSTEYLDLKLSVRIVPSCEAAIEHIRLYSSRHTDGIITEDSEVARQFLSVVDSSGVYHNCSTRFADGFRYGFGAEVGISTQTLPPRGPVGLEGLVTYRYLLHGDGHIAADFAKGDKVFTHRNLSL